MRLMRNGSVQFYTILICSAMLLLSFRIDHGDADAKRVELQYSVRHAHACWTEVNEQQPSGYERICGDVSLAPSDAREFSDNP